MRCVHLAGGAAILLTVGLAASAQQPAASDIISQPVAESAPHNIPYGPPITLADAKKVIDRAQAEAKKHDWKLACAVVEPTGDLVLFEKMDDTQYASIDVSMAKAKAAARYRRSIKTFLDAVKGGNAGVLSYPGVIAGEGAFPIIRGGKLIGAIGCSGAASNQDATAAFAGLEEIK